MKLRKPFLLLFACALAFAAVNAIGVSTAAASTTEECLKEKPGLEMTSQHFEDENCTKKSGATGLFHTTSINGSSVITMKETKEVPISIEATLLEVKTVINCASTMAKQTVSNFELEKEVMGYKGTIPSLVLSSCTVSKPSGCTVKPIETAPLTVTNEDLKEVQRTLFAPSEGSKIGTLTVSGCAVAGSYAIEGNLRSQTVDIHTEEFSSKSGSELTIGKATAIPFFTYCWVTEADNKPVVKELP
jgi:hypothetical protein